jgi:hypothetical protein
MTKVPTAPSQGISESIVDPTSPFTEWDANQQWVGEGAVEHLQVGPTDPGRVTADQDVTGPATGRSSST